MKDPPPGPLSKTRMCIQMSNTHMQVLCHAILSEVTDCIEIKEEEQNTQTDKIKCFVCGRTASWVWPCCQALLCSPCDPLKALWVFEKTYVMCVPSFCLHTSRCESVCLCQNRIARIATLQSLLPVLFMSTSSYIAFKNAALCVFPLY